jgi:hypothetical protein
MKIGLKNIKDMIFRLLTKFRYYTLTTMSTARQQHDNYNEYCILNNLSSLIFFINILSNILKNGFGFFENFDFEF